MPKTIIFHNPRCSKSRQTLAILEEHNLEVVVIKYLDNPPSEEKIRELLAELNLDIRGIIRTGEQEYKEFGFDDNTLSDDELISKLTKHPKVMQRPIVSHNGRAIIGRPPENVLDIIK